MAIDNHIRNPIEWGWSQLGRASHAVGSAAHGVRGTEAARQDVRPEVRRLSATDIGDALAKGFADFGAYRTDVIFACLVYPIAGLVLSRLAFGYDLLPLIFPLVSGFALLGPVAAIGLYEMSRRRAQGHEIGWASAFGVVRSPAFGAILILGFGLLAIFLLWLGAASAIYRVTLGPEAPASLGAFLHDVFATDAGWTMIAAGCGVGFLFALLVLTISVVSFPMLLDRDVGVLTAVGTSIRTVARNPGPMALWGLVIALGLVLGSIPALLGLAIVVPILGHATWHLYRKAVA
ncbi:MAG: DUF2189 domain-containing protein [Rhodospirillaceae bacterium]|nr:DUF2189 domain-containing protein [Rhodospirillaceae bacterium]